MIDQGIVMLVQADPTVSALCSAGGFADDLPKDANLPTWFYRVISERSDYTLSADTGFNKRWLEINCCGATAAQAIQLAKAINTVLSGYRGTLPDPDSTLVDSILSIDSQSFFDDARRSYRRMIEFDIWFYAS